MPPPAPYPRLQIIIIITRCLVVSVSNRPWHQLPGHRAHDWRGSCNCDEASVSFLDQDGVGIFGLDLTISLSFSLSLSLSSLPPWTHTPSTYTHTLSLPHTKSHTQNPTHSHALTHAHSCTHITLHASPRAVLFPVSFLGGLPLSVHASAHADWHLQSDIFDGFADSGATRASSTWFRSRAHHNARARRRQGTASLDRCFVPFRTHPSAFMEAHRVMWFTWSLRPAMLSKSVLIGACNAML